MGSAYNFSGNWGAKAPSVLSGLAVGGVSSYVALASQVAVNWGVAKWLRHRFLVSAFGGSNPPAPANFLWPKSLSLGWLFCVILFVK